MFSNFFNFTPLNIGDLSDVDLNVNRVMESIYKYWANNIILLITNIFIFSMLLTILFTNIDILFAPPNTLTLILYIIYIFCMIICIVCLYAYINSCFRALKSHIKFTLIYGQEMRLKEIKKAGKIGRIFIDE